MGSVSTQFKKGQVPWNKGKKGSQVPWNKGLSKATDPRVIGPWEGKKRPDFPKGIPHLTTRGENHYKWIEDRNQLKKRKPRPGYAGRLSLKEYWDWMYGVKDRDKWLCKINNEQCAGRLEAHHILNWNDHPELRYEINNGITLCRFHHPKGRNEEKRLILVFKELVAVSKD